ncbi:MAG: hypothetical protein Q9219_007204 [cf. Caloplaca sp. 3 TL-2023]
MTQHYKNALISTILKEQQCHIQCSSMKSSQSDATSFEPEPGMFCNAKCWKDGKNLKVYGLDEISKPDNAWGFQLQAYLQASYDHYKSNGLLDAAMLPSTDDLLNGGPASTTSGNYLVVCVTHLLHKNKKDSGVPCMCGDRYGSETTKVWTEAGFDRLLDPMGKDPPYLCKNDMAIERTLPVPYFLTLCHMDRRWPTIQDGDEDDWAAHDIFFLQKGADPLCSEFQAEVNTFIRGDNGTPLTFDEELLLSCYMCFDSKSGRKIQYGPMSQNPHIYNLFGHRSDLDQYQRYNFHKACQLMEDDHGTCKN